MNQSMINHRDHSRDVEAEDDEEDAGAPASELKYPQT